MPREPRAQLDGGGARDGDGPASGVWGEQSGTGVSVDRDLSAQLRSVGFEGCAAARNVIVRECLDVEVIKVHRSTDERGTPRQRDPQCTGTGTGLECGRRRYPL